MCFDFFSLQTYHKFIFDEGNNLQVVHGTHVNARIRVIEATIHILMHLQQI